MKKYGCFLLLLAMLQGCIRQTEVVHLDIGKVHPFEVYYLGDLTTRSLPEFFDLKSGERLAVAKYTGMFVVPQLPEGKYRSVTEHKDRKICLEFVLVNDIEENDVRALALEPMLRSLLDSLEAKRTQGVSIGCSFSPALRDSILLLAKSIDKESINGTALRTMHARTNLFQFYLSRFGPMWANEKGFGYQQARSLNPAMVVQEIGPQFYSYATRADTLLSIYDNMRKNRALFADAAAYEQVCELAIMCQYIEWNEFLKRVLNFPVTAEKILRLYTSSGDSTFYSDRYYEDMLLDVRYSNRELQGSTLWNTRLGVHSQMGDTRAMLEDAHWIRLGVMQADSNCVAYRSIIVTRRADENFRIWANPTERSSSIEFVLDTLDVQVRRPIFFEDELRTTLYGGYSRTGVQVEQEIGTFHLVHHEGRGILPGVSIRRDGFTRLIEGDAINVKAWVELERLTSFSHISIPVTWFRDGELIAYTLSDFNGRSNFEHLTRGPDRLRLAVYLGDWRTETPGPDDAHIDFDIVVE